MNLNRRASFVIFPVLIISYALMALIIYEQQSRSIIELEQSKLDQRANALRTEFSSYNGFLDAYLVSLVEGETLARFIREPNNIYKERELSNSLKSSIQRYFSNTREYASLAVLNSSHEAVFYVENSTDPFAELRKEQRELSALMRNLKVVNHWKHFTDQAPSLLEMGVMIDARTLTPPLITQLEETLQVIVSITPRSYNTLLQQTAKQFQAKINYSDSTDRPNANNQQLFTQTKLRDNYFLNIAPAPDYLQSLMFSLQGQLVLTVIVAAFLTYLLLLFLIRRFITFPITKLDHQLSEVMARDREHFEAPDTNDEIGRLGRKFQNLYSELNLSYQESRVQARTDALTKLPNRASFYEAATRQLAESEKSKSSISIVYIDLDNFKFVNDKYGHEMGDELLKAVANRLNHILFLKPYRKTDTQAYRLSGDEFIIMMPDSDTAQAVKLCKKILQHFSSGYQFELGHFPVTASLGIATYPADGHTLSQLISNADLAMYQAKKSGRNAFATYSQELAKRDRQIKEIESKLKEINFDQEFSLYYMPIIDKYGNVKGFEALLRWHSPQLGMVSPALFIPIAESTGCFEQIDLWVIEQAFKNYPTLKQEFNSDLELSINISSAEIGSELLIDSLKRLCNSYPIDPQNFVIEITETFATDDGLSALSWLEELRKLGFKIAIDDFGTGYTSLMQMVDYPVDIIKFDKTLVERITQADKKPLASALIDLCHLQEIAVVAEGIEDEIVLHRLIHASCDFHQGFFIAKPMPLDALKAWHKEYKGKQLVRNNCS